MKILNLEPDGYSPEALAILQTLGEVVPGCGDNSGIDALIVRLANQIDADFLKDFPRLKYIVTATTGLDHIDLKAAEARGIKVLSLKGEGGFLRSIPATAELTWGLILSLTRNIPAAFESVKRGEWERDAFKGYDLKGKTLGIIGLGRIGEMVARYGEAFGMRVIYHDPNKFACVNSLETILARADIISLHVPLNDDTRGLIEERELAIMKPGSYLINTSRGEVIHEAALLAALNIGHLAGAALDVVCDERGERNLALLAYARAHDNLIITPHIGGCTFDSMEATEVFMAKKLAKAI